MIVEKHTIKTACQCDDCGRMSKFITGKCDAAEHHASEKGWLVRHQTRCGKSGRRLRSHSWTVGYYCPKCRKGKDS